MALLECLRCATRFAVGLLHCPHCLSEEFQEADVPKITTGGGVSHPADHPADGSPAAEAPAVPAEPEVAAPAAEVVTEPAPEPEPEPEPAPKAKAAPSLAAAKGDGD